MSNRIENLTLPKQVEPQGGHKGDAPVDAAYPFPEGLIEKSYVAVFGVLWFRLQSSGNMSQAVEGTSERSHVCLVVAQDFTQRRLEIGSRYNNDTDMNESNGIE